MVNKQNATAQKERNAPNTAVGNAPFRLFKIQIIGSVAQYTGYVANNGFVRHGFLYVLIIAAHNYMLVRAFQCSVRNDTARIFVNQHIVFFWPAGKGLYAHSVP